MRIKKEKEIDFKALEARAREYAKVVGPASCSDRALPKSTAELHFVACCEWVKSFHVISNLAVALMDLALKQASEVLKMRGCGHQLCTGTCPRGLTPGAVQMLALEYIWGGVAEAQNQSDMWATFAMPGMKCSICMASMSHALSRQDSHYGSC